MTKYRYCPFCNIRLSEKEWKQHVYRVHLWVGDWWWRCPRCEVIFPCARALIWHCALFMDMEVHRKIFTFLETSYYSSHKAEFQWLKENMSKYHDIPAERKVPICIPMRLYSLIRDIVDLLKRETGRDITISGTVHGLIVTALPMLLTTKHYTKYRSGKRG